MTSKEDLLDYRKIDKSTGCWLFTGGLDNQGYGLCNWNGKTERVHRISAYLFLGLDLETRENIACHKDNICPNKHCFNPKHLYKGTSSNNRQDILTKRPDSKRSHCKNGHEFTKENSYYSYKGRDCLTCREIRSKIRSKKLKKIPELVLVGPRF